MLLTSDTDAQHVTNWMSSKSRKWSVLVVIKPSRSLLVMYDESSRVFLAHA